VSSLGYEDHAESIIINNLNSLVSLGFHDLVNNEGLTPLLSMFRSTFELRARPIRAVDTTVNWLDSHMENPE
jgi:hypothetical protein